MPLGSQYILTALLLLLLCEAKGEKSSDSPNNVKGCKVLVWSIGLANHCLTPGVYKH